MIETDCVEIRQILRNAQRFLVSGHINPDGDSLGCTCALQLALRSWGKRVVAVSPDGVPDLYRFLPGSETVVSEIPAGETFDVALVVDCETLDRLGPVRDALPLCGTVIEIDHHPGLDGRGSGPQLIVPSSASSGEVVYDLLAGMGAQIDSAMAECLLTAIITDTGSFRFANTTSSTLRVAANLLDAGVATSRIAQRVYDSRPFDSVKLLGLVLSTLTLSDDGRVAYACNLREFASELPGGDGDAEGIVSYVRSIRGVTVGILFTEATESTTRVSLRSRDGVDVSQVARQYGGGGHKAAAGCTVDRPLREAVNLILDAIKKCMAS